MLFKNTKEKIEFYMGMQKAFFNPAKAGNKHRDYQFVFNEEDGVYNYYLSVKNRLCSLIEGRTPSYECEIITDLKTWTDIGGKYIQGKDAMRSGKFRVNGGLFKFLSGYRKIFSIGRSYAVPEGRFMDPPGHDKINNVLFLSCSPRAKKGATHFLSEFIIKGMKDAGANVELVFPADLKINPCIGCFKCWLKDAEECIYQKDDMKSILNLYDKSELLFWATPVYIYHGTTVMKTVMDRFFVKSDPRLCLDKNNNLVHPRKTRHLTDYALFATAGLPDLKVFEPLSMTFKIYAERKNAGYIAEIFRPTALTFLLETAKAKDKDNVLNALYDAGKEIIINKKVSAKTKKKAQQPIADKNALLAAGNFHMEHMLKNNEFFFENKF